MPDTDNYYRLVTFIINTCASVLRRLFLEQARICAGTSFTTVQAYLRTRQRDIDKLKMKKIISKKQYELLFPSAVPVDENNWDISLLSVLIKNLYPTVQSTVITDVLAIRDVRNNMQHIANTAHISYSDFDKNWKALRSACLRIALFTKGRVYEEEIEKEIEASLTNSMPNLGDSLRQWYTREFAESLYKRIDELSEEIRELRKDTSKASATLNAVITKRPSATAHGKPFKRIKATTPISERPFDEFRKFMTTEMTPNIQPHVDCTEIKNRISTRRIAVITGYGGSHYIHTTAHAIRELNLKEELCTLITDPSDWKHINPMELQLVLFKCPFGDSEPNEEKARVMFDVMDSIKQTLLDDKCNMFVVVLSQTEVMRAAIEIIGKSHDLLEDPVTCHKENTKLDPDIIGQGIRSSVTAKGPNNISNLLELTDAYKTRLMRIDHMSPAVIEAKKQMKSSKVVLLTGKNQHDLTQVGLSLATSYNYGLSQFLIVRKSEELVNVPIKNISLLMIENLAGKYDYEKQRVSSWLEILEMLLSVVVKKQLKIVLTLESEKLTRCILDFKKEHEVFSYLVEVNPAAIRYIKDDLPAQQTPLSIRYCRAMLQQEVKPVTLTFVTDLRLLQEEKDEEESNITGMTVVEDRFLVATDWKKKCLRCFDIDIGKQIHRYTMEVNPCSITTLPDSRVAVTQNDDIHFIKVSPSGQLKFEKKIKGGAGCKGIVYSNDQLVVSYIDPGSNVHILDMEGNISKVFQKNDAGENLFMNPWGLAMSSDNNTIYVSDWGKNTVTALSQDGRVLGDAKDEGNLRCLRDITVDSTGRVYVCGEDSHTVCLVSSETGPITRLLGEEDDVRWPLAVAVFDKTSNLYVGMRASKVIKVFHIE